MIGAQWYSIESIIVTVLLIPFVMLFIVVGDTLPNSNLCCSTCDTSEVMNSAIGLEAARDHRSVG
jgi:hypothetical protein